MLPTLILLLVLPFAGLQATDTIRVAVLPPTVGEFVDAGAGVLDSIRDIKRELQRNRKANVRVVNTAEEADVVLWVVARGVGAGAYSAKASLVELFGTVHMTMTELRASTFWLDTVLASGSYKRQLLGKHTQRSGPSLGAWKETSYRVCDDAVAWIDANRAVLVKNRRR